jgi:hypothetical protein
MVARDVWDVLVRVRVSVSRHIFVKKPFEKVFLLFLLFSGRVEVKFKNILWMKA